MTDVGGLTLLEAARAVRERDVSPVELTEHALARIEETEPVVHAWVTVAADAARAAAREAEAAVLAGADLGPLHGVPMGVKDLLDTAGTRTTYGSARFGHHVPTRDATAVARLRGAGAVLLGKHATHELAWGGRTDSAHYGPTHNPHRRGRIPGGSSGGSAAAVVVGSCWGALGTDTAGSVRIPAALSGCVGYKPSRGRVSLAGVLPLAPSLDHVGALARTVADAAAIVDAVAGPDPADPGSQALVPADPAEAPVVAALGGWATALLDPGVAAACDAARDRLQAAGVRVVEVDLPAEPATTAAVLTRVLAEAHARHRAAFEEQPDAFGADLRALLGGAAPTPAELATSEAVVARTSALLLDLLATYDALLLSTVPVLAPEIGATTVRVDGPDGEVTLPVELALTRLTSPFNATGLPAVSVPAGSAQGLPVGVQVVGRPWGDRTALALAALVVATEEDAR
jgi:aspartyl-tRNA(Asn)/glutamyl-tRNA(Gln) amidotransferase subunit A